MPILLEMNPTIPPARHPRTRRTEAREDGEAAGAILGRARAEEVPLRPRLRLSVPQLVVPLVVDSALPAFQRQHGGVAVELVVEDGLGDPAREELDASVRFSDTVQVDLIRVSLVPGLRFVVAGAPSYLRRRGVPRKPEDLLEHECLRYRSSSTKAIAAWELEQGDQRWHLRVRGPVVTNGLALVRGLAEAGLGLAYLFERGGRETGAGRGLVPVLGDFTPARTGLSLYLPVRQRLAPVLQAFVDTLHATLPRLAPGSARTGR
jgi:DNA-binding transcriptional LysR family regulator